MYRVANTIKDMKDVFMIAGIIATLSGLIGGTYLLWIGRRKSKY